MQSSVQTASATPSIVWADYLIIALVILFLCFDYVRSRLKQEMTREGAIQINYAESVLLGLCLLSLLLVYLM